MSNPSTLTLSFVAAVSNGICLSQQPAAAGALTLNGSLVTSGVATLDAARRILVSSTGADSAVVFTITGTDRGGSVQSSTVTGVTSTASQYTSRDFLTVTGVSSSAGTAGNITVGTNQVGSSVWVVDDFLARFWALGGGVSGPTGTTYTVESTFDDPNDVGQSLVAMPQQFSMNPASNIPALAWANPAVSGASGNNLFSYTTPIFAHRVTINSWTGSGGSGTVVMQSIQAALGSGW